MRAFLTGSRAYGKPREDSDTDIVVMVTPEVHSLLKELGKLEDGSIRFGNLNIIAVETELEFIGWKAATEGLINRKQEKKRPVTRDEAIVYIDDTFKEIGLEDPEYDSKDK